MRKYGLGMALIAVGLAAVGYFWFRPQKQQSATVEPSGQQATPRAAQVPVQLPVDAPTGVVEALAQLKPGITVADWRGLHPDETWYKPTYDDQDPFVADYQGQDNYRIEKACAISTGILQLPGASSLRRKAVFYLPPPPVPLALPEDVSASRLVDTCTLAYLETRLTTDGNDARAALDEKIQSALTTLHGEPTSEDAEVTMQRTMGRRPKTLVWKQGEAKTVIGRIDTIGPPDALFSAYSYLPNFRYEMREFPDIASEYTLTAYNRPEIFDLAMRTTALDVQVSKPMNDLYHEWRQSKNERRVQARDVVDVLRSWLQASSTLPSQRRAAALLAGQFVFEMFIAKADAQKVDLDDIRSELMSIGAEFYDGEGGLHPGHAWIQQARELNPEGPIGDAITLMSLANWWVDGDDYFAVGKKYLSQQHDGDSTAWVEYFLASAYQNIVIVGHTGGEEPEQPPTMTPTQEQVDRGAAARLEAIKHYRAVLAIDSDKASRRAVLAWRTAWKLMADLPVWYPYL